MSLQPILVDVTASTQLLDAVRTVTGTLDGHRSVVLTAFNFTELDLVLDHVEHERGAFHTPPHTDLPAGTAMVFSAHSTGSMAGPKGRLDWSGTHPDSGDFQFHMTWNKPLLGASTASAWHFHRLPWPGYAASNDRSHEGMAIETEFLRTSAIAGCGHVIPQLYYELHPHGTTARSIGALSSGLHVDLGEPVVGGRRIRALARHMVSRRHAWRAQASRAAAERRKGAFAPRRLAAVVATLTCFLTATGGAAAQTSSTVQFESTYRAYNVWDDWKWWQPDKCTQTHRVFGGEPAAPGRYPVLLYTHGMLADWGANAEGKGVVEMAAAQGFVAAALTYDSWMATGPAAVDGNAKCMFSGGSAGNALAQVCARPKADCTKGVVVAGFSAGGAVAARAGNFAHVRAASVMGVNGPTIAPALATPAGSRALPNDRVRFIIGQSDVEARNTTTGQVTGIDVAALNALTGSSCSASPCLRPDGSGYYVVEHSEVADRVADHCYWLSVSVQVPSNSCTWNPTFDPGFRPPATAPWSLASNLAWLRSKID